MDLRRIRNESIRTAQQLGVDVLSTLPLLDAGFDMRSAEETVPRILAMNVVAATAYGFDKSKAVAWLKQEKLTDSLSEFELPKEWSALSKIVRVLPRASIL